MQITLTKFYWLLLLVSILLIPFYALGNTLKYDETSVEGWTVFVEPDLANDPDLLDPMLERLAAQLQKIKTVLPTSKIKTLTKTPFWLVKSDRYADQQNLLGLFFSSEQWLEENGYDTRKYLGIQFNSRFGSETSQNIVFHELAHAFHAGELGLENKHLIDLFEKTSQNTSGARDGCPRDDTIYAFSNVDEFFATFSQAYFGGTCSYPRNRNVLRLKHPEMFEYLSKTWGF